MMERAAAITVRRSGGITVPAIKDIEDLLPGNYEVQPGQTHHLVFISGWDVPGGTLDDVLRKLHTRGINASEVDAMTWDQD